MLHRSIDRPRRTTNYSHFKSLRAAPSLPRLINGERAHSNWRSRAQIAAAAGGKKSRNTCTAARASSFIGARERRPRSNARGTRTHAKADRIRRLAADPAASSPDRADWGCSYAARICERRKRSVEIDLFDNSFVCLLKVGSV